jgi:hypothetical protein
MYGASGNLAPSAVFEVWAYPVRTSTESPETELKAPSSVTRVNESAIANAAR